MKILYKDKLFSPLDKIGGYTIVRKIGEGRYGICYLIEEGQKKYLLKQLKRGILKKVGVKAGFEEKILMKLQCVSIPRFIERIETKDFYGYVLEYKDGKIFEDIIYSEKYAFTRAEIFQVGAQLIDIIKYLHFQGVVHRDIRVPNTIYDGGKVYLVDFGLARWIDDCKYKADIDFAYLGDFLLHLYYSFFEIKTKKKLPWYKELDLSVNEMKFFKKLMGIEKRYLNINEVENDFLKCR